MAVAAARQPPPPPPAQVAASRRAPVLRPRAVAHRAGPLRPAHWPHRGAGACLSCPPLLQARRSLLQRIHSLAASAIRWSQSRELHLRCHHADRQRSMLIARVANWSSPAYSLVIRGASARSSHYPVLASTQPCTLPFRALPSGPRPCLQPHEVWQWGHLTSRQPAPLPPPPPLPCPAAAAPGWTPRPSWRPCAASWARASCCTAPPSPWRSPQRRSRSATQKWTSACTGATRRGAPRRWWRRAARPRAWRRPHCWR